FFLIGLALLIYLMTRAKETEADELEDAGDRGLLATVDKGAEKKPAEQPEAVASGTAADTEPSATMPLFSEADFKRNRAAEKSFVEPLPPESAPVVEAAVSSLLLQNDAEAD